MYRQYIHLASVLQVNFNKRKLLGIGVNTSELNSIASIIGFQVSQFPCMYRGLPIGDKMSRFLNWSPLVERFQKRLSKWKSKNLSFGGRLTLIRSVLGSLGVYYFSTFKAPKKIIDRLESIRRKFFWGGNSEENKISWIAWKKVISLIPHSGLGICSLKSSNQAMLSKWWWRFRTDVNALWCNIIRSIHGPSGGLDDASSLRSKRGPWYHIEKLKDDFLTIGINLPSLFKKKIGNGCNTRFWLDNWLGGACLYESYPRLFRLKANPNCLVHDRAPTFATIPVVHTTTESLSFSAYASNSNPANGMQSLCFNWAWSRPFRSGIEVSELRELCELLAHLRVTDAPEVWEYITNASRVFSVKGMRSHITNSSLPQSANLFRWNKVLSLKVNINTWRIIHKRVPTRSNLDIRGVDLDSIRCPICDDEIESEEHIFVMCNVAGETWKNILLCWKIDNTSINNLDDAINLADQVSLPTKLLKAYDVVVQTTL